MTMIHWYFHSQNVIEEAWLSGVESDRRKLPRRKRAEGRRGATPLLRPSFSDEWNPTRGQRFYRQSSRRQEQSLRSRGVAVSSPSALFSATPPRRRRLA